MAVADHGGHAGYAGKFFGGALGIATRHQNARLRVQPVGATDESTGFTIGFGGDAAGVYHHHVSLRQFPHGVPEGGEAVGHGLAVGARRPAAEILDMEAAAHFFQCTVDADFGGSPGG